ncbi:MAG: UDP-2,3-diacylglucosamine diphosphatase, partial [Erythrobacter sp.]
MTSADLSDLISDNIASFPSAAPRIPEPEGNARRSYRTVWISDVHLGTKGCNAEMLIDFLDNVDSETMYLVGDIIDGWRLKKKFYWPSAHNDI